MRVTAFDPTPEQVEMMKDKDLSHNALSKKWRVSAAVIRKYRKNRLGIVLDRVYLLQKTSEMPKVLPGFRQEFQDLLSRKW